MRDYVLTQCNSTVADWTIKRANSNAYKDVLLFSKQYKYTNGESKTAALSDRLKTAIKTDVDSLRAYLSKDALSEDERGDWLSDTPSGIRLFQQLRELSSKVSEGLDFTLKQASEAPGKSVVVTDLSGMQAIDVTDMSDTNQWIENEYIHDVARIRYGRNGITVQLGVRDSGVQVEASSGAETCER